jgi:hypothetical protein
MILDLHAVLRRWLPLAALAVVFPLLVYATVQQSLRSGANDPQLQLAEDAAAALEGGAAPGAVLPAGHAVAIESSLAPFVVVYDADGRPLAGSGQLHGRLPSPPAGVFEFVRANGAESVTLQPERGVRIASVVRRVLRQPGGYVLAGRSLREVEVREGYTRMASVAALGAGLVGTFVLVVLGEVMLRPREG